ncbi:2451_t:CDS:1, partial [Cetraspora pellucida]
EVPAQNLGYCTSCNKTKNVVEFCRSTRSGLQQLCATCNQCSFKKKNKRIKKSTTEIPRDKNITDLDEISESLDPFSEHLNNVEDEDDNSNVDLDDDSDNNDSKVLRYDLDEVCEITKKLFEEAEVLNETTNFTYEIEMEDDLLIAFFLTPLDLNNNKDLKIIESNFRQLAHALIVLLESGSGYYWEIRKIYLNTWNKKFS